MNAGIVFLTILNFIVLLMLSAEVGSLSQPSLFTAWDLFQFLKRRRKKTMKPRSNRYIYYYDKRSKNKPYRVIIEVEKKKYNIGYYLTAEEARTARDEFNKNHFSVSISWQRLQEMNVIVDKIAELSEILSSYRDISTNEVIRKIGNIKQNAISIKKIIA